MEWHRHAQFVSCADLQVDAVFASLQIFRGYAQSQLIFYRDVAH